MEMIHQKSKGPIASLKRSFSKQIRFVVFLMIAMIATQIRNLDNRAAQIFIGTYMGFCILVALFFYWNYRVTDRLEAMDTNVKTGLENYVSSLSERLKWHNIGVRIVALIFILLLEIVPLFLHARMLDKWHELSPFIRFPAYAAFLLLQYFTARSIQREKFGQHLAYLEELIKELK